MRICHDVALERETADERLARREPDVKDLQVDGLARSARGLQGEVWWASALVSLMTPELKTAFKLPPSYRHDTIGRRRQQKQLGQLLTARLSFTNCFIGTVPVPNYLVTTNVFCTGSGLVLRPRRDSGNLRAVFGWYTGTN